MSHAVSCFEPAYGAGYALAAHNGLSSSARRIYVEMRSCNIASLIVSPGVVNFLNQMKQSGRLISLLRNFLLTVAVAVCIPTSHAVVILFTGGNGANLNVTFTESFQLTLNQDSLYTQLVFRGIYSAPGSSAIGPTNAISYTLNGNTDPSQSLTHAIYDWNAPVTTGRGADDFSIPITDANVTAGATYTFAPGQVLTTVGGWISDPATYSSSFDIYLINLFGVRVSNVLTGTTSAIPEPSTWATLAGIVCFSLVLARRRFRC